MLQQFSSNRSQACLISSLQKPILNCLSNKRSVNTWFRRSLYSWTVSVNTTCKQNNIVLRLRKLVFKLITKLNVENLNIIIEEKVILVLILLHHSLSYTSLTVKLSQYVKKRHQQFQSCQLQFSLENSRVRKNPIFVIKIKNPIFDIYPG